jgi:hypothetical protein
MESWEEMISIGEAADLLESRDLWERGEVGHLAQVRVYHGKW